MAGKTAVRKVAAKKTATKKAAGAVAAPVGLVTEKKTAATKTAPAPNGHATGKQKFDEFLAEVLENPEAAAAFEEAMLRTRLSRAFVAARNDAGLSQAELGKAAGINQSVLSLFENGKQLPTVAVLYRYARACNARLEFTISR